MSDFRHSVYEAKETTKRTEHWSIDDLMGYMVVVTQRDDDGCSLSISPSNYERMRLGILECRPRSVADLEKFAQDSGALLLEVAKMLRELGKDDLRSQWDIMHDDLAKQMEKRNG